MTVYAVQVARRREAISRKMVPHFNLEPAKEYGQIVELLSPLAKPFNPQPIIQELTEKLKGFSDSDYVICIGNPILIAMAINIAASFNCGKVKALQWQNNVQKYISVDLEF